MRTSQTSRVRTRTLSLLVAVTLVVTGLAMSAQAVAVPTTLGVTGIIKDWDTDLPVEDIVVRMVANVGQGANPNEMTTASVFTTLTAADGSFTVTTTAEPGWFHISYIDADDVYRDQHWFGQGTPIVDYTVPGWIDEVEDLGTEYVQTLANVQADRVSRVAGTDRFKTAMEMSELFQEAPTVVLANGLSFPDALAAAPLAGCYDAPILLTGPDTLPSGLIARLNAMSTDHVIIVGGTGVVSNTIRQHLQNAGFTVERVAGTNRYATAEAIVRRVGAIRGPDMPASPIIVRGDQFADALAIAPFAWLETRPIILTEPNSAPPDTIDAYRYVYNGWGSDVVVVIGGTGAVSYDALGELWLNVVAPGDLYEVRIAGSNRYDTAARCVSDYWAQPLDIYAVASGLNFPDALSAGPALGAYWGGVLLTDPNSLASEARTQLRNDRLYVWDALIAGGTGALSNTVLSQVQAALGTEFYDMNLYSGVSEAVAAGSHVLPSLRTLDGEPDAAPDGALLPARARALARTGTAYPTTPLIDDAVKVDFE